MTDAIWDAVVIGAGPAGGVSATLLARRGWKVLLLERAAWPRTKVCGGCINASAVAMLQSIGLGDVIARAPSLDRCSVRSGANEVVLNLPPGAAVARREFDAAIVELFREAGGTFLDRASAIVLPGSSSADGRDIAVRINGESQTIRSRVVLACDGIAGTSLDGEPWAAWHVPRDAWFGVAATLPEDAIDVAAGRIEMHAGRGGYVGLVREPTGTAHLAAALDPMRCKSIGGPESFVRAILSDCRRRPVTSDAIHFNGTGLLTRRRIGLGGHRVLAVGDACGYVEPFTGEGVAWAIRSAIEVTDLLSKGEWSATAPHEWTERHRQTIGRQQRACRMIRFALHRPWLMQTAMNVATFAPRAANAVAQLTQAHGVSLSEAYA